MAEKSSRWKGCACNSMSAVPLRVLQRGYAICTDAAGNVVNSAEQVSIGGEIKVQLAHGRLGAEVRTREIPKP